MYNYPLFKFGPRWWYVVNTTPLPLYYQESYSVPILQEAGLASGPVLDGHGKSDYHRGRTLDRPPRSESLH